LAHAQPETSVDTPPVRPADSPSVAVRPTLDLAAWRAGFDDVFAVVAGRFAQACSRKRARAYLLGLLSRSELSHVIADHELSEIRIVAGMPFRNGVTMEMARFRFNKSGVAKQAEGRGRRPKTSVS
jgi:hypothetical protein